MKMYKCLGIGKNACFLLASKISDYLSEKSQNIDRNRQRAKYLIVVYCQNLIKVGKLLDMFLFFALVPW